MSSPEQGMGWFRFTVMVIAIDLWYRSGANTLFENYLRWRQK